MYMQNFNLPSLIWNGEMGRTAVFQGSKVEKTLLYAFFIDLRGANFWIRCTTFESPSHGFKNINFFQYKWKVGFKNKFKFTNFLLRTSHCETTLIGSVQTVKKIAFCTSENSFHFVIIFFQLVFWETYLKSSPLKINVYIPYS